MVNEAGKFKEQDREVRAAVASRNELESYIYQMRSLLNNPGVSSKIGASEKTEIAKVCNEVDEWLRNNSKASERDYAGKKDDIEKICKPVILRIYSGRPAAQREFPASSNDDGPVIEEAD